MCEAKCKDGLDFKDLTSLNQNLVAKKGWRVIQNHKSLVAKVLQPRYFKSTYFFKVKLGSKLSYIW